jgi:hypothetical protein
MNAGSRSVERALIDADRQPRQRAERVDSQQRPSPQGDRRDSIYDYGIHFGESRNWGVD